MIRSTRSSAGIEKCGAALIIPHIPRMLDVRKQYGELEVIRYGRPWGALELMDGLHGDLGKAFKLETGSRGMRDGFTPLSREHEVSDITWSFATTAPHAGLDSIDVCQEAGNRSLVQGTPRQLLNRLAGITVAIDELLDPPSEPVFTPPAPEARAGVLTERYVEGFRTVASLAVAYSIDLAQSLPRNMGELEARIGRDLTAA